MAGQFVNITRPAGYEKFPKAYYRWPVEAWRDTLDSPEEVVFRCLGMLVADTKNKAELREVYQLDYDQPGAILSEIGSYELLHETGKEYLDEIKWNGWEGRVPGFTMESQQFYECLCKARRFGEYEWLVRLWWMALHTMGGKARIRHVNNNQVFCRAGGFSSWDDFNAYNWNGDEAILRYIVKDDTPDKVKMRQARLANEIRADLRERYQTFHDYSGQGVRGWYYMLSDIDRQAALDEMAEYAIAHSGSKTERRDAYRQMKADAVAKAKARRAGAKVIGDGAAPQPATPERASPQPARNTWRPLAPEDDLPF